jgi:hypothetical protein
MSCLAIGAVWRHPAEEIRVSSNAFKTKSGRCRHSQPRCNFYRHKASWVHLTRPPNLHSNWLVKRCIGNQSKLNRVPQLTEIRLSVFGYMGLGE